MPRQNLNLLVGGVVVEPWKEPKSTDEWLQLILQEIKSLRHVGTQALDALKVQEMEIESLGKRTDALESERDKLLPVVPNMVYRHEEELQELQKWQAVMVASHPRRTVGVGALGAAGAACAEVAWKVYQAISGAKHP